MYMDLSLLFSVNNCECNCVWCSCWVQLSVLTAGGHQPIRPYLDKLTYSACNVVSKLRPLAAPPSTVRQTHADVCWCVIGTDSCILRDRNITSIKNSTFCLSANAVGNLTKLINMTADANKTYVSPSEEYFKWVPPPLQASYMHVCGWSL